MVFEMTSTLKTLTAVSKFRAIACSTGYGASDCIPEWSVTSHVGKDRSSDCGLTGSVTSHARRQQI